MSESSKPAPGDRDAAPLVPNYEMIRRIGRGGYGDVWLAKDALNTYRAVKVVRRSAFDHDRPYEREFNGLRQAEPISRQSEGQLDILHVGRNDSAGYFYYVMELADDEERGQNIDPENYKARTLRSELHKRERLPAAECVELGLQLAKALGDLHRADLVHRDVKPANIVFVKGVPKLADIGLVTGTGDAKTLLGTDGYLPREGAGTPQADLYALGKVLYEASTGRKCSDYPEPPTALKGFQDREQWLRLNAVILRACSEESGERFQSAADLAEALRCLKEGRAPPAPPSKTTRRKWGVAAVAVAALAACVLLAPTAWRIVSEIVRPHQKGLRLVRTIEVPGVLDWAGAKLGDFDGDGTKEIFLVISNQLLVVSADGKELRRSEKLKAPGAEMGISALEDVDGDGKDEIFISWRGGTNLYSGVLDQNLRAIQRFEAIGSGWDETTGSIFRGSWLYGVAVSGNPPKLFGWIGTGYALRPRGLLCMDFLTRKVLWQHSTAPGIQGLLVQDLDGDGEPDVVAGSSAVGNGNEMPDGTDDYHCYIYGVSASGKELWKPIEMGDVFTGCMPLQDTQRRREPPARSAADLFGGQVPYASRPSQADEFFVAVFRAHQFKRLTERGEVWRMNRHGRVGTNYDAGAYLVSWMLVRRQPAAAEKSGVETGAEVNQPALDGTTRTQTEILVTDRLGRLHVLDRNLGLKRLVELVKRRYESVELFLDAVCDLDGDGQDEFLLHSSQKQFASEPNAGRPDAPPQRILYHDNRILVVDRDLKVVGDFQVAAEWRNPHAMTVGVSRRKADGRAEIIVLADRALVLEWSR